MVRKLLFALLVIAPLGFFPFLRDTKSTEIDAPKRPPQAHDLMPPDAQIALHTLSALPGHAFPGNLPWESLRWIAADQSRELEALAEKQPVKFLELCRERYLTEVQGYRCTFAKHEKVKGVLRDAEVIRAHFREQPFSVHMEWKKGEDLCFSSLYVEGENDGCLLARSRLPPLGFRGPILTRPLDAADVQATSRFGINRFGIYTGQKDTLDAIQKAEKAGTLHLKYHGIETVEKAGNRLCYKLVRSPYEPPEEMEDLNELTIYIDRATLFQVGSILRDAKGEFVAEYFFRDIELNPKFDEKQFTRKAL